MARGAAERGVDIAAENAARWDREVEKGNQWTLPVTPEQIAAARRGEWTIGVTNRRSVPRAWFPDPLAGARVLCLGGGGGQQGPILAATGAEVTVLDVSAKQLARDEEVAKREGLTLRLEQGDMQDLSRFADGSFDLVVNPASVGFVPDARRVWRECARVLRPGGALIAGSLQPVAFLFDPEEERKGRLVARFPVPHDDTTIPETQRKAWWADDPISFGHSMADLLGGQLDAGLVLVDMYEDGFGHDALIDWHIPALMATLARKPAAT